MKSLIKKFYSGTKVTNYDESRSKNPKWQFENDCLKKVLNDHKNEISTIGDIPVGTGRTFSVIRSVRKDLPITGYDLSEDMLTQAEGEADANINLLTRDIIEEDLDDIYDLTICYRFLNLIDTNWAVKTIHNIHRHAGKFSLLAIRTIPENNSGPVFIENKIHLQDSKTIEKAIDESGFQIEEEFLHEDQREGDYRILFCKRAEIYSRFWINKNNRAVYVSEETGQKVKIYEANNEAHAQFITHISNETTLSNQLPEVIDQQGKVITSKWIVGEQASPEEYQQLIQLLIAFEKLDIKQDARFDYVEDILLPRMRKYAVKDLSVCEELTGIIRAECPHSEYIVVHPDVTCANLIKTADGLFVIIDNEILCKTRHRFIGLLNHLHNLKPDFRRVSVSAYFELNNIDEDYLDKNQRYLNALWAARRTGSLMVTERFEQANQIIESWKNGELKLPVE